jgi:mannose-6-phosphate isomerase-like protein (cupin superfamily)
MQAMRFFPILGALGLCLGCSRTAPESHVAPAPDLPVKPLPEEGFGDEPADEPGASAPADPKAAGKPKSVDAALPNAPPTMLARHQSCAQKECRLTAYLPDASWTKAAPGGEESPGAIWAHEIAEGSSLVIPRHHQLELNVVGLAGNTQVGFDEGGAGKTLGSWDVLRAPGAGLVLKGDKGGSKVILALVTTTGTLSQALTVAKDKPFLVRWTKRPKPIGNASLANEKDLAWGGGAFHARIAFGGKDGALAGSVEALKTSENAAIAVHDHPTWEHIAILEGAGTMRLGDRDEKVVSGSVFDIPPGVKHAFLPSGKKGLLAIQSYTPSGPEQRFVKLANEEK